MPAKKHKKKLKMKRPVRGRIVEGKKDSFTKEIGNIILAIIIISLIFAYDWLNPLNTFENFYTPFIAVTTSFLLYHFAQRVMSRKLKCNIAYRLWVPGVVFGLLFMLVGIKIILIGGILISAYKFGRWGMKDRLPTVQEIGFISVVGPLTNIFLAIIFGLLAGPAATGQNSFFAYMSMLNSWLAIFNLVPIKDLDGGKIMFWSPVYWFFLSFFAILLIIPVDILSLII